MNGSQNALPKLAAVLLAMAAFLVIRSHLSQQLADNNTANREAMKKHFESMKIEPMPDYSKQLQQQVSENLATLKNPPPPGPIGPGPVR
jgi:hypothetical protein